MFGGVEEPVYLWSFGRWLRYGFSLRPLAFVALDIDIGLELVSLVGFKSELLAAAPQQAWLEQAVLSVRRHVLASCQVEILVTWYLALAQIQF